MTCDEIEREDVAEDYVLGRLDGSRQQAFEDHYFDCTTCLARLRAVEEIRAGLTPSPSAVGRVFRPGKSPKRWNLRAPLAILAAAAVLVLAVRTGHQVWTGRTEEALRPAPAPDVVLPVTPAPSVTIELPAYAPARLRAIPGDAQRIFRDAMTQYTSTNCAGAVPGLQRALTVDETYTQARFYLGACQLHGGDVSEAVVNLQRVIAAGESPYLEDAHWFRALARVKQGDVAGAREQLQRVIDLDGDRRAEAARLLTELRR